MQTRYDIFDANCTVGMPRMTTPPLRCFLTVEDILAEMDYFGIREALIAHAGASVRMNYMEDCNRQILSWAEGGRGRLHPCWVWPIAQSWTQPDSEASVSCMLEHGVKAVRLLPDRVHPDLVDDYVCGSLLNALEKHRIPVFLERNEFASTWGFEFGVDYPRRGFAAPAVYTICQNHPNLPVVLMWLGGTPDIVVPLLNACPNLYLDFPKLPDHNHFEAYLRAAGAHRLLYGSGLPRSSPGKALAIVNYSSAGEQDKALIFGENMRRLTAEVC